MSDSSPLERGYRRVLACYPKAFRRESEDEILAVLLATAHEGQRRVGVAESADLIIGAVRMHLRSPRRPRSGGHHLMNRRLTLTAAAATVLASVSLYSLITTLSWFWAGVGAVIVTAAVGALTRLRTLPVIVCLLASLAGLVLYLNALFAGPESLYRLIPTPASVHHLILLAERANSETSKFAPPIPEKPGIVLLAAAGIGIVAIATDLLAVRLRRPALAGLPLLVLFCVPMTTIVKPGWVSEVVVFSLGIAGYLALLSARGLRDRPLRDDGDAA